MKLHRNAALSWNGRRLLVSRVVENGWTMTAAAAAAGISVRCARKWVSRYRLEGEPGLFDRSSAPQRVANRTAPDRVEAITKLRRLRFTAAEIAEGQPPFDWRGEPIGGRMSFRYLPPARRAAASLRHRAFSTRVGLRVVGLARRRSALRWRRRG